MTKAEKKILFGAAMTIKTDHPDWTDFSCLEEGYIQCVGFRGYVSSIAYLLPEFKKYIDNNSIKQ
jgi:hypothetical protein